MGSSTEEAWASKGKAVAREGEAVEQLGPTMDVPLVPAQAKLLANRIPGSLPENIIPAPSCRHPFHHFSISLSMSASALPIPFGLERII